MRFFENETEIDAPLDRVWQILTNGSQWTEWAGIDRLDRQIAQRETIRVHTRASGGRALPMKVATWEPPRTLGFRGGTPVGLFTGVRTYRLMPNASGGTHFGMREEYTGPLLPMMWRSMPDLNPSFRTFAAGLNDRAERSAAA